MNWNEMELLTITELAEVLKVKKSVIYGLTRESKQREKDPLPVIKLTRKALRFDREAVTKWLLRLQTGNS
jgi:excisionase family DNA binding protein